MTKRGYMFAGLVSLSVVLGGWGAAPRVEAAEAGGAAAATDNWGSGGGAGGGGSGGGIGSISSGGFVPKRIESLPAEFVGVDVTEKINVRIPLELTLYNEQGDPVTLARYFNTGKPVILQMGYFGCPKLCSLISQGTVDSLREIDLQLGKDYSVLFVSIDPEEKAAQGLAAKKGYIERYVSGGGVKPTYQHDGEVAAKGWHFLTGPADAVKDLAQSVGFGYKYVPSAGQYSHPSAIMLLTPDGRVSRYLYGVSFDPKLLKLSLVETGAGKVGSVMDKILLLCFHFDPNTGTYSLAAMKVMRLAGAASVLALGSFVGVMAWRRRRLHADPNAPKRGLAAVMAQGGPDGGARSGGATSGGARSSVGSDGTQSGSETHR